MIRNNAILVCKGYAQVEGIDFEETYAPLERLEGTRMFLELACHKNFKVYQMDVKFAFLNAKIEEELYIEQPEGFLLSENRDYVCKLKKGTLWSQTSCKGLVFNVGQLLKTTRI